MTRVSARTARSFSASITRSEVGGRVKLLFAMLAINGLNVVNS